MDIGIRCRKVGFRLVFVVMEYWNASRRMRDVIIVHRKPVRRVDPFFFVLDRLRSYYYVGKTE